MHTAVNGSAYQLSVHAGPQSEILIVFYLEASLFPRCPIERFTPPTVNAGSTGELRTLQLECSGLPRYPRRRCNAHEGTIVVGQVTSSR